MLDSDGCRPASKRTGGCPVRRLRQSSVALVALLLATLPWSCPFTYAARVGGVRPSARLSQAGNPIQAENALPGTSSWLIAKPAQNNEIEGYASTTSAVAGDLVDIFVSTRDPSFTAEMYRMGWYGGSGGRLIMTFGSMAGSRQMTPSPAPGTGLVAAQWQKSFSFTVSSSWVSGIYMVKLTSSTGFQSYVPLVIRDTRPSDFVFVRAVNTDEAYNAWGGKSLYGDVHLPYGSAETYAQRAVKVSFNRPFDVNAGSGLFFNYEYDMVRWLERSGYDVTYITDIDEDQNPALLLNHKGILIAGHDEYWSKNIYDGLENAVAHGVNLGIFGGDTASWQMRYESLGGVADRVEVCYRVAAIDPLSHTNPQLTTVNWWEPPLNRPEQAFIGLSYGGVTHPSPWVVKDASSWIFAGTEVTAGTSLPGLVGYEYMSIDPKFPRLAGLDVVAESPVTNVYKGPDVSQSVVYTAGSGALVVNMGSIEWAWGLDNFAPSWANFPYGERPQAQSSIAQAIATAILAKFRATAPSTRRVDKPVPRFGHTVFVQHFDAWKPGPLPLSTVPHHNRFTGTSSNHPPIVERGRAFSRPNALVATLTGGGSSFAFIHYPKGYTVHDLRFEIYLGSDMRLPSSGYMVLARTSSSADTLPGKVDLVINGARNLYLDYFTGSGARHYLFTRGVLRRGAWHLLEVQERVGKGTGRLQLLLDGQVLGKANGLNMGNAGVSYVALGDVSTPQDRATAGHLYIDNVRTATND